MKRSTSGRRSVPRSGDGSYVPDVGDIIRTNFTPQAGSEQAGPRPALVLTPRSYNAVTGLCGAAPITSKGKPYPFVVAFPDGLKTHGVVLADHTRSLSWAARGATFVERAPSEVVDEVKAKLAALYGLD